MLAALALATVLTYDFRPEVRRTFDVAVKFEGYVPVLGGTEGTIDVEFAIGVQGLPPDEKMRPRAVSEIEAFVMKLNGTAMPFDKANIQSFFPRTTVSLTPEGKVEDTDAPDKQLPVRLPGLDIKRFPDITYVPIEFPKDGIEVDKTFTFRKAFGKSDATYDVTPMSITDDAVAMKLSVRQQYVVWEDARHNPASAESAVYEAVTDVKGEGTATFDRRRGLVSEAKIVADAQTAVTDLKSKAKRDRKLRTTLTIKARS